MDLFFWLSDLLLPVLLILIGLVMGKNPCSQINKVFGYRSKRSMASQAAWDYAQRLFPSVWVKCGCGLLLLTVLSKLFVPLDPAILSIIHIIVHVAILLLTIPYIEKKLKNRFDP